MRPTVYPLDPWRTITEQRTRDLQRGREDAIPAVPVASRGAASATAGWNRIKPSGDDRPPAVEMARRCPLPVRELPPGRRLPDGPTKDHSQRGGLCIITHHSSLPSRQTSLLCYIYISTEHQLDLFEPASDCPYLYLRVMVSLVSVGGAPGSGYVQMDGGGAGVE